MACFNSLTMIRSCSRCGSIASRCREWIGLAAKLIPMGGPRCCVATHDRQVVRHPSAMTFGQRSKSSAELAAHLANAIAHVSQLLFGRPARCLAQAAVGSEREPIRRGEIQAGAHAAGNVVHGF